MHETTAKGDSLMYRYKMMYVSDRIIANNKGTQDFWSDLGTR